MRNIQISNVTAYDTGNFCSSITGIPGGEIELSLIHIFSGQVEVSVTYNKGEVKSGRVRPLSYGITPRTSGSTITFTLDLSLIHISKRKLL